jgi:hypothetical protein
LLGVKLLKGHDEAVLEVNQLGQVLRLHLDHVLLELRLIGREAYTEELD